MGYPRAHLAAANTADDDYVLASVAMKGTAYTLTKTDMPTEGARKLTFIRTVVDTADTPGKITVVGRSLAGVKQSEEITIGDDGVTVTSTKWYAGTTSLVPTGWAKGGATADNIKVGVGADIIVAEGNGTLIRVIVNATAAGKVTLADSAGTIADLKASIAEDSYLYEVNFSGYLKVTLAAASDVTVVYSK